MPTTLVGLIHIHYKDPRQDLTATQPRVNNSGLGLSSPASKQPYTKPFSGLPSGLKVTSPYREAGGTFGGRPGIVYPLLPCATRPDTKLVIDVMTQAAPTANSNLAHWRATRPRSEANDRPEMRNTPVKHPLSFTSSPLSQPPISAANQNRERSSSQDHSENLGLYKPAPTDPN